MVSLHNITHAYNDRILFSDVFATINPHDRIGLIGQNGSGKSTLLQIIAGLITPTQGSVQKAKYVTIGYLPQEFFYYSENTVYKEVESVFSHIYELEQQITDVQQELTTLQPTDESYNETLEILGVLQHRLELYEPYKIQSIIEEVLSGLGFRTKDFTRLVTEFSGGWQMRIALAKLLLQQPNLLLLDEPTNHLDLPSLQWLEKFLSTYDGALIIVSHDRSLLNSITNRTFSLRQQALRIYTGNYNDAQKEEALEDELLQHRFEQQQKYIQKTEQFINRFRYKATKARQVQSRIKQLEKLEQITPITNEETISFHFPPAPHCGRVVFELRNIQKSYDHQIIFKDLSLTVQRGDRIAIVGYNGAGKSTLLRIIAGIEPFDIGNRTIGHNVHFAYFAQQQALELDLTIDVMTTLEQSASTQNRTQLRTLLGSFLFRGDDVFKSVSVLSGGEKSRLALAKILLQDVNVLLLDEPTNHLDIQSKDMLRAALQTYDGTILIVSHDRDFLDPLITKVWEVKDQSVKEYPGTLSEFLSKQQLFTSVQSSPSEPVKSESSEWYIKQTKKKQLQKQLRQLQREIETIEKQLQVLEHRKTELELTLSNPEFYKNGEQAKNITAEYRKTEQEIETLYALWSELVEKQEQLNREDHSLIH